MKTTSRRRTKRPNLTNLMPVISSCSMSYASMSLTPTQFCPEEPGRSLTAVDFTQKTIMPKPLKNSMFQEKKKAGTTIIPDKLYLTSITEAESFSFLKNNKITAILTINIEPVRIPLGLQNSGIKTKFINLADNCTSHIKSYFDEMNDFIERNERVVVHCYAGKSRSATAVIAYLMKTSKMTLDQALQFVQSKRHVVCPNFSFMGQLKSYQDELDLELDFRKHLKVFSKLELNRDHDSGVDTSESSNESPLGSPKNKIQKIEFENINIKKTLPMQI